MRQAGFPLALAMAMTMAAPALAKTWDVCVNPATDVRFSTESVNSAPVFFVGAAPIFPSGTLGDHGLAACPDISRAAGTFFAMGGQVAGLPAAASGDGDFVFWHFRLKKGSFDTMGPAETGGDGTKYPQTIIGSTNGAGPANGQATVTTLVPPGVSSPPLEFRIALPGK